MSLFHREKAPAYDPALLQPAVRKSYCNREMTLGFIEKATGTQTISKYTTARPK